LASNIAKPWRPLTSSKLTDLELGQILDGLEIRAESWARTAEYLRTEKLPDGEFFIVEECSKLNEAEGIAKLYRSIVRKTRSHMEAQE
jgi:hypothetical protein